MAKFRGAAIATIALLAMAAPAPAQQKEIEYPNRSLAYDALMRGDYARAEAELESDDTVRRDDPAKMLNYGLLLSKTGRTSEARTAFREVLSHSDAELVLSDGRVANSHDLAKKFLNELTGR